MKRPLTEMKSECPILWLLRDRPRPAPALTRTVGVSYGMADRGTFLADAYGRGVSMETFFVRKQIVIGALVFASLEFGVLLIRTLAR